MCLSDEGAARPRSPAFRRGQEASASSHQPPVVHAGRLCKRPCDPGSARRHQPIPAGVGAACERFLTDGGRCWYRSPAGAAMRTPRRPAGCPGSAPLSHALPQPWPCQGQQAGHPHIAQRAGPVRRRPDPRRDDPGGRGACRVRRRNRWRRHLRTGAFTRSRKVGRARRQGWPKARNRPSGAAPRLWHDWPVTGFAGGASSPRPRSAPHPAASTRARPAAATLHAWRRWRPTTTRGSAARAGGRRCRRRSRRTRAPAA